MGLDLKLLTQGSQQSSDTWPSMVESGVQDKLLAPPTRLVASSPGRAFPVTRRSTAPSRVEGVMLQHRRVTELRTVIARRQLPRDEVLDEHPEHPTHSDGGVADVVLAHDVVVDGVEHAHRASPIAVVRRCPMGISLATFGAE